MASRAIELRPSGPRPLNPTEPAAFPAGPQGLELVVEMAHDLRSPLTSVLFLAEAMQDGMSGPVNEIQRRQLGLIRSAALCLCATASDVMEFARGDRLVRTDAAPLSIREIFAAVRAMVQPMAEEKGLELKFHQEGPDCREGHERALSRILLNLTTNALKYTERGHVEISARAHGPSRVQFSVRDTGPGIDPTEMRTLFQPFRRRDGDARLHFSSAGLGLGIVRKLVAAVGGELRMVSRPGRGTRFWFEIELPAAAAVA